MYSRAMASPKNIGRVMLSVISGFEKKTLGSREVFQSDLEDGKVASSGCVQIVEGLTIRGFHSFPCAL
jgi:hypothetical protein